MFFTQYNPQLFLLCITVSVFTIGLIYFTQLRKKRYIRSLSLILGALTVAGMIKYRWVTASDHSGFMNLFLVISESCFIACISTYFAKYRLLGRRRILNSVLSFYILVCFIIFFLTVYSYPNEISACIFVFRIFTIVWFLPLFILIPLKRWLIFPLLTRSLLYLAAYTVATDIIMLAAGVFSSTFSLFKADIIIYCISYWSLAASYFKPVIPIPVFSAEPKADEPLPESIIEECLKGLKMAFEEKKLYLNPELTLQTLAAEIDMPARTISTVLNSTMQKNFRDYINGYRVEEAKRLLTDYRERNLTIAAVAYEAGFNSLATFQRVFKKMTGKTPKEFT